MSYCNIIVSHCHITGKLHVEEEQPEVKQVEQQEDKQVECKHRIESLEGYVKKQVQELDECVASSYKNLEDLNRQHKRAVRNMEYIMASAERKKAKLQEIRDQQVFIMYLVLSAPQ